MVDIILHILLVFMILGAVVAIHLDDLLSSVISLGSVGLGLSIAFLILQAPDLAIVQLVVEILCLVILIRATIQKDLPGVNGLREYFACLVAIASVGIFIFVAYFAFKELPKFGEPIMKVAQVYLNEGLSKTGAANIVAAVILDYRALDTLGEATVLFTAVIGVLAVLRKVGKIKAGD